MTSPAHERIERFSEAHIWVIGDCMLDEYIVGSVSRVSPEAPVPVVGVTDSFSRLGGAANVANAIAALGARVSLCGAIGKDPAGDEFVSLCASHGIDARPVRSVDGRPTTRKLRVLGQGQQLLRMDWEDAGPCPNDIGLALVARLEAGPHPSALIISDYAKGFLTDAVLQAVLQSALPYRVPILVDPKGGDFARYRGATLIKPNLHDLEAATGRRLQGASDDAIGDAARSLIEAVALQGMIVTLGERGMLVVPSGGEAVAIPARPREVYDVTGAGDTVAAVMALGLAIGMSLEEAAQVANAAAGIAVAQVGTAAVHREELTAVLQTGENPKLLSRAALAKRVATWKLRGKQVVFTNGCFDLLHAGHLSLLHEAAKQGDILIVGINSDVSVSRLKGAGRPLVAQADRASLLASLACTDAVVIFDEDTPLELIREIQPAVLVKGQDYAPADVVGRELVEADGGRVALVPLMAERSTTALLDLIRTRRRDGR